MGPPRNAKVQPTAEGYLVTWDPPLYGKELVRYYNVKWFRGTTERLYGRAETADPFYLGQWNAPLYGRFNIVMPYS